MKYFIYIILLFAIITNSIFAHHQTTHQYIVVYAYKVLENYLGIEISPIKNHIGGTSSYFSGDYAFQRRTIATGAFREDEEDIIYNLHNTLPAAPLDQIFGDGLVSITHFWEADLGDNDLNDFDITFYSILGGNPHIPLPNSYPNAYTKFKKYAYNNRSWDFEFKLNPGIATFDKASGGSINITHCGGVWFSYNNIVELYTTGRAWITAYYNCPNAAKTPYSVEIVLSQGWRDAIVWEILGRMAHLLGDMSVPAHAHRDEHAFYSDSYEDYMGYSACQYLSDNEISSIPFMNPISNQPSDPLHFLMYVTQQVTDHFASNGQDFRGNDNDDNLGGNGTTSEINYINSNYNLGNFGLPLTDTQAQSGNYNYNIKQKLYPLAISATAGLYYWFAVETGIIPPVQPSFVISPTTNYIGSGRNGDTFSSSFTISNTGNAILQLEIASPIWGVNLEGQNPAHIVFKTLYPSSSTTINYTGTFGVHEYGPFTQTITIDATNHDVHGTHTITGTLLLPDFCESQARATSPEEFIFDKAFIDYYSANTDSLDFNKDKTLKERLSFAYNLLKQPETESVDKICKMIIELYPESEMGISFYSMGLLWEATYSDEVPDFNEKDFTSYLKELIEKKEKYKINGYAQLILSLLDVGNDIRGLERLFTDYKYDALKELALFHQFIHYYVYKQDKVRAREISDRLDKMFIDSKYGYQAHLIFGDEGYSLEGLKKLMEKKKADLLAKSLAKSRDNRAEILSEMPKEYKLFNNYPNPFNPTTTIKYSVPKVSNVKLTVYNMMGQLIKTLVNETKAPGFYNVEWNGTNENNSQVSSGIYFYRFESGNFIANNKMILLK